MPNIFEGLCGVSASNFLHIKIKGLPSLQFSITPHRDYITSPWMQAEELGDIIYFIIHNDPTIRLAIVRGHLTCPSIEAVTACR